VKVRRSAPFLVLALLLAAVPLRAQTAEEVLARHAKAVDPEGKVGSIEGMKMTATFEIPSMGMSATMVAVQRRPNQSAVLIGIPGIGEMRQGFDGTNAWASDPMQGPRLMTGPEASSMSDGADFRGLTRAADLFSASEVVGEVEVDGQKCIRIKHTWKSGRVSTDCYSTATWLVIESIAKQQGPQGEMEAVSRFSDFKPVNGIVMAHKTTMAMMNMQQVITITSVEFGPQPESAVAVPAEVQALIKKP